MSSSSAKDRALLSKRINLKGKPSELPCDQCFRLNRLCISMPGFKCSECTRLGRKCTNMSFAALDNTISDCDQRMEDAMEEMSVAMAKYMRYKKIKRQAEERNKMRMSHIQHDLSAAGELDVEDDNEDCPAADATVGLSPAVWSAMDFMNNAVDFSLRGETVAGGSGSS